MSFQPGFFDLQDRYEALSHAGDPLEQLHDMIPWDIFRKPLKKALKRKAIIQGGRSKGGRPSYDDILMFKIMVLQALYNLSDDQMEYQIRDCLSFMRFLGLDLESCTPDAKTIWLFRDTLAKADVIEVLFSRFDGHLKKNGLRAIQPELNPIQVVKLLVLKRLRLVR